MTARSKISLTLFLALSAVTASGFAYMTNDTPAAANEATPAATPVADPPSNAPAAIDQYAVPPTTYHSEPRVTVTAPRPSEDELLRTAVMDRLSEDAYLAGRIGVESYRHTVSLTGRVTTTGQIERAGMIAASVNGVRDVNNYLLARVGMS
jgi:hypothetical protein